MSREVLRPSGEILPRPRRDALVLWALAIGVGLMAAAAIVTLRTLVSFGEFIFFGAAGPRLTARLVEISWLHRLIAPLVGGVIVALVLRAGMAAGWGPNPRPFGVEDIVAARRLRTTVKGTTLGLGDSFLSGLATVFSLGSGASVGREATAMHLGASLALLPGRLFGLDIAHRRRLVAMGVAAGLAAALHAPIAAVLIARQLMAPGLRLASLGPLALASYTSWLLARAAFPTPVIGIPEIAATPISFHVAAILLAPPLAALAWACMRTLIWTPDRVSEAAHKARIPIWTLPAIGGAGMGLLLVGFPAVAGLGFTPLEAGLGGGYGAGYLLVLAAVKLMATALCLSCRFGGGPIAPILFIAGMFGSALGAPLGLALGDPASAQAFFGALAMGVALAVIIDAPFAAAVLMLELSGSYETGAATLVASMLAVYLVQRYAPGPALEEGGRHPLRWT
jgi:CIC family chloride channel protein